MRNAEDLLDGVVCPGQLFISLWRAMRSLSSPERAGAVPPSKHLCTGIAEALRQDDGRAAVRDLIDFLIDVPGRTAQEQRGRYLAVMEGIDSCFYAFHPKYRVSGSGNANGCAFPEWVLDLQAERLIKGYFSEWDGDRLILKGPLLRDVRSIHLFGAELLSERFCYISVMPSFLEERGRNISIRHVAIAEEAASGVPLGAKVGTENVVFVPIATLAEHLRISSRVLPSGQKYVDFSVEDLDAAEYLASALRQASALDEIDIGVAPELVMSESDSDRFSDMLRNEHLRTRVIFAGSGKTRETYEGQPYNMCRIFNGMGAELWRQSKVWPARIDGEKGVKYHLGDSRPEEFFLEDNAASSEIVVADIQSLGRCIVLICQDVKLAIAARLVEDAQPDWVIVPILDYAATVGRWAHQEVYRLSDKSDTRFLISCSVSLKSYEKMTPPRSGYGLALSSAAAGRRYKDVHVNGNGALEYGLVQWHEEPSWDSYKLS